MGRVDLFADFAWKRGREMVNLRVRKTWNWILGALEPEEGKGRLIKYYCWFLILGKITYMDLKKLIEQTILSLTSNESIETIMLKAQTIAFLLKEKQFIKWVRLEQNGYSENDKLPSYRIIPAQVFVDISIPYVGERKNFPFPPGLMGEFEDSLFHIPFHNSITEINRFIDVGKNLQTPIIAPMYLKMNEFIPNGNITNARQQTGSVNLSSILSSVKSKLLEFLLNINDKLEIGVDLTKLETQIDIERIVNQTIYASVVNTGNGNVQINKSEITGQKNDLITLNDAVKEQLLKIIQQIDLTALLDKTDSQRSKECIETIQKEVKDKTANPRKLRKALKVLKSIPSIIAQHGIELLIDQGLEMLTQL